MKVLLDSLPVESSSIKVIPTTSFRYESTSNSIVFDSLPVDSVTVCYHTVSPELTKPIFNRDIKTYSAGRVSAQKAALKKISEPDVFDLKGFDSYGSITRGVGFGNRQNVFVNSSLNLQMDGQLSENLFVSASITDQNVPYQPEGNTQQIRDFDNVFIKLYNDNFDLTVGDIVFQNPVKEAYFLRYYKNVQGLQLRNRVKVSEKWRLESTVSGSVAKGQFTSVQLQPIEGVQGPYKLTGPNNEQFVIVLANSEHVFIDGVEMKRGFDRDYVIDYNLGEITFSPGVLITRFTRIRVDFEYSEQYYGRSNLNLTERFVSERSDFYLSFYQEKDNPNNTLGFELSQADYDLLGSLGDANRTYISGVDSVEYLEHAIFYQRRDTLYNGTLISIYEYSTDPDLAMFKVSFSNVGSGIGDYQLLRTTANGRVYEWVGEGNGDFDPVINLPTPNMKQVTAVGGSTKLNAFESVAHEWVLTNTDRNLYSDSQDGDNIGGAGKVSVKTEGRTIGSYKATGTVSYEYLTRTFSTIDRFRGVEYDRNWGYNIFTDTVALREDQIAYTGVSLQKDASNYFRANSSYRHRVGVVNGTQTELDIAKNFGPVYLKSYLFNLDNQTSAFSSEWLRSTQDVSFRTRYLVAGYALNHDLQSNARQDSVVSSFMHFTSHNVYLMSGDSLRQSTFRLDYIDRMDQSPVEGKFRDYTHAKEVRATAVNQFLNQRILTSAIYRQVDDLFLDERDHVVLGKLDWKGTFAERLIKNSLVFTTANTRELMREYVFVQVQTGQGTHTWRDENEDGIQDLNEFYEAINADEKNYIKVFTPTNTYLTAYQSTIQQNLDIQLPDFSGAIGSQISKLSFNVNNSINQKTTSAEAVSRFFPMTQSLRRADVIFAKNYYRYSLFYNRNGDGVAVELRYGNSAGKSLLSNGFELRKAEELQSISRIPFGPVLSFRFQHLNGRLTNESDFLASRNFELERLSWSPQLVLQPTKSYRVIGKVDRRTKSTPDMEGEEFSKITEYALEGTFSKAGFGNINVALQWLDIRFAGVRNSFLGYELLEGLSPGQNQRWTLNWQQSLNRGLQLSVQYIGRKSSGASMIHTGNMQLTAYF